MVTIKKGIYRHYKGNLYRVIGVAKHSETLEEMVVYIALDESKLSNNAFWVRPTAMFLEMVELNGNKVPRFEFLKEEI